MKKVKVNTISDGFLFKRTEKSNTWFIVISKSGKYVVATSTTPGSNYSCALKNSRIVYIPK